MSATIIRYDLAKFRRDTAWVRDPEACCEALFGSDALLLCEDKSLIPSERRRILGDKELMRLYREAHSAPEERSQKSQKEPTPGGRLIPFPLKPHKRDP